METENGAITCAATPGSSPGAKEGFVAPSAVAKSESISPGLAGVNFVPKMETMAFGTMPVTGGVLRPAPTTPPGEMCGAVGETAAVAVAVNETLVTPGAAAVIVRVPAVFPRVTDALAEPSGKV